MNFTDFIAIEGDIDANEPTASVVAMAITQAARAMVRLSNGQRADFWVRDVALHVGELAKRQRISLDWQQSNDDERSATSWAFAAMDWIGSAGNIVITCNTQTTLHLRLEEALECLDGIARASNGESLETLCCEFNARREAHRQAQGE